MIIGPVSTAILSPQISLKHSMEKGRMVVKHSCIKRLQGGPKK